MLKPTKLRLVEGIFLDDRFHASQGTLASFPNIYDLFYNNSDSLSTTGTKGWFDIASVCIIVDADGSERGAKIVL